MADKLSNRLAKADKEIIETLEAYMRAVRDEQSDDEEIKQYAKDIAEDIKMLLSVGEQTEIEQLKMNSDSRQTYENIDVAHIKSEAIREVAERLKNKSELLAPSVYAELFRAVSVEEIDNLVAEMTEDDNEKI